MLFLRARLLGWPVFAGVRCTMVQRCLILPRGWMLRYHWGKHNDYWDSLGGSTHFHAFP